MKRLLFRVLIAAGAASPYAAPGAAAFQPYGPPVYGPYAYGPPPFVPGYRHAPFGIRRGLPNGTGYRGGGTFTGGPAGGLPSRN